MRLLVSVRDAQEARAALAGGADWIDVKEPLRGALGAADPRVWREVLAEVAEAAPVSAALGELIEDGREDLARSAGGLGFVKIGLAGAGNIDWRSRYRQSIERLPRDVAHIAVVYADWRSAIAPSPGDVIAFAAESGAAAILFDTFDKRRGKLFDHFSTLELAAQVASCRERGLVVALAGSLAAADLPRIADRAANLIAVRGAVCLPDRQGAVDSSLVRHFKDRLSQLDRSACFDWPENSARKNRPRFA